MTAMCVALALVLAVIGLVTLSPATTGVGLIGLACLLGILGRIVQASAQYKSAA